MDNAAPSKTMQNLLLFDDAAFVPAPLPAEPIEVFAALAEGESGFLLLIIPLRDVTCLALDSLISSPDILFMGDVTP